MHEAYAGKELERGRCESFAQIWRREDVEDEQWRCAMIEDQGEERAELKGQEVHLADAPRRPHAQVAVREPRDDYGGRPARQSGDVHQGRELRVALERSDIVAWPRGRRRLHRRRVQ